MGPCFKYSLSHPANGSNIILQLSCLYCCSHNCLFPFFPYLMKELVALFSSSLLTLVYFQSKQATGVCGTIFSKLPLNSSFHQVLSYSSIFPMRNILLLTFSLFCMKFPSLQLQKHISAEGHPYHKFSTGQ